MLRLAVRQTQRIQLKQIQITMPTKRAARTCSTAPLFVGAIPSRNVDRGVPTILERDGAAAPARKRRLVGFPFRLGATRREFSSDARDDALWIPAGHAGVRSQFEIGLNS